MISVEQWRSNGLGFIAPDLIAQIQKDARQQGRVDMTEDIADLLAELDRLEASLERKNIALIKLGKRLKYARNTYISTLTTQPTCR